MISLNGWWKYKMKKLFILGSTRGLGKEILKLAVNEEFEIRCLVSSS